MSPGSDIGTAGCAPVARQCAPVISGSERIGAETTPPSGETSCASRTRSLAPFLAPGAGSRRKAGGGNRTRVTSLEGYEPSAEPSGSAALRASTRASRSRVLRIADRVTNRQLEVVAEGPASAMSGLVDDIEVPLARFTLSTSDDRLIVR